MKFHERWSPLRCRERGAALPMALAFLVLFAVLMGLIFDFIGTGMASNAQLKGERNDLYTVNGAVDAAISKIQNDPTLGMSGGDAQCALNSTENGSTANVTCAPSSTSGTTVNTTSAPPFSILTMAPFTDYWNNPHTPSCSTISTAPGAELGVIQFQKDKLLRVQGNVYVNSDVDSDNWGPPDAQPGCPAVSDALAIHVNGDVKVREGCNDMYPVTTAFLWQCSSQNSFTPYQAPRATNGPALASDPSFADPAIANPASWAPDITSPPPVQSVPSCPANNNVVKFLPGTYNDAAAMSALMNGISCPGRTFWFSPGVYYFDFANGGVNGNHEWRINDSNSKVVAGQPNAVPSGSTPVGPVQVTATGASTSSPGFTGPTDAILIGGNLATTGNFSTSNQQRWLRANGYSMAQSPIPPGSSAPVVQLHVVHGESWDTTGSSGTQGGYVAGSATPVVTGTCPTTVPTGQQSTSFCLSNSARAIGGNTAVAQFATNTSSSRAITLAGGWTGTALPAGATVSSLSARVAHRESTTSGSNAAIGLTLTGGAGCSVGVNPNVSSSLRTDTVTLPACFGTDPATLSIGYNASYTCSTSCPAIGTPKSSVLDGIDVTVNYTTPAPVTPQFGSVQVQVRDDADTVLCTVDLAPTANNSIADATIPVPAGCLSQDQLNNGTFSLRYQVTHGTCTSACQNITSQLDGMELLVSYSAPGRSAWDPNDPAANPTVPGACRHDGDPFWSDGVQFVFGGDSRVYLQSGQVELCNAPSTTHQEIVLYQVKKATGATSGTQAGWRATTATPSEPAATPCPTALPAPGSAPFCVPSDALSLNATGATARFAGLIPAATPEVQAINLAGGWSGTALPAGAQVTGVSALVRHREAGTGGAIALALSGSAGGGCAITTQTVTPVTGASLGDQTFTLPACVNTNLANLSLDYTASYSCAGPTGCPAVATPRQAILDGIELTISYTIPASTGALSPARGCITQVPYYNPSDHSPGYDNDGAGPNPTSCALFKVAADAPGGDGHFPRVVTFWGTVYAPSAAMDVPVDVLTVPVFGRGVVARMLMLGYKVATDAQVPVTTAPFTDETGGQPQNRTVTLTGQANGKPTKVVATVEFCDLGCPGIAPPAQQPGGRPAVKVYSWQVTR